MNVDPISPVAATSTLTRHPLRTCKLTSLPLVLPFPPPPLAPCQHFQHVTLTCAPSPFLTLSSPQYLPLPFLTLPTSLTFPAFPLHNNPTEPPLTFSLTWFYTSFSYLLTFSTCPNHPSMYCLLYSTHPYPYGLPQILPYTPFSCLHSPRLFPHHLSSRGAWVTRDLVPGRVR